MANKKNNYSYISLFAGAGGLDIGFNELGFKCLFANDIEEYSESTFQLNWPKTNFLRDDIRNLNAEKVLKIQMNLRPAQLTVDQYYKISEYYEKN